MRNGHLAGQTEWKGVCVRYGMLKDEKETESLDSAIMKSDSPQATDVEPNQEMPEDVEHHVVCQTEEIESM